MCLLGVAFQQFANAPVVVFANREEFYSRPTAAPRIFPGTERSPTWFGGLDLLADGTWLGVNGRGLLVAVTNRVKSSVPSDAPSRGVLCRRLLGAANAREGGKLAVSELRTGRYAGGNFLLADPDQACVIEAADLLRETWLQPGLHLLTNTMLNDVNDVRIARVRREFALNQPVTPETWLVAAEKVCSLSADGAEPAICRDGRDRGTVSSTLIALANIRQNSIYRYSDGSPKETAYLDYSSEFRQIFSEQESLKEEYPAAETKERAPHTIALRGPWQIEVIRAIRSPEPTAAAESKLTAGRTATVRLPASWGELFGEFRGRIRFNRRFHPPTNVGESDRLSVVITDVGCSGTVLLNGDLLGTIDPTANVNRYSIPTYLPVNASLSIELELTGPCTTPQEIGLINPVIIEIDAETNSN